MNVVTSAMSTSAANSASEITPFSSARLSTMSSVSPRVFMSAPITADSRQPQAHVTREASTVPPNLQAMATTSSTSVSTTSSARSSSSTLVFRPV